MKQLSQNIRSGKLTLEDVPAPALRPNGLLIRNAASLVSAGTERMARAFAEKNLLQKARSRPDLVHQTLNKMRREGIMATLKTVRSRLDQSVPLGYSSAGVVIDMDARVEDYQTGDHVACAGGGYATHSEIISVPLNLVVKTPNTLKQEEVAFTTLGAIALHGIRTADVKLGETVAVIGLGLLGQLTVQLLRISGCRVIAMDINAERAELARQSGADIVTTFQTDLVETCGKSTSGRGVDAVLITADTQSNEPVEVAGEVARERGIVVAVGAVGTSIPRKIYYEKELDFRISRSYGPGRYDRSYEEEGHDYPYAHVRWTENRNLEAFVQCLANGTVDVASLITHRFPINEASKAYDLITGQIDESFLGVVLTYPESSEEATGESTHLHRIVLKTPACDVAGSETARIGLLGAGKFSKVLLPILNTFNNVTLSGICTATGLNAQQTGQKYGFQYCTTDEVEILNDPDINTVVILTRHNLHARQIVAGLQSGKHVFCEKPPALKEDELEQIIDTVTSESTGAFTVGYNRRFSPMMQQLKSSLDGVREPLLMQYRINAGSVPPDNWIHDIAQGGGRIIGEVCHFVDTLTFLAGSLPVKVSAHSLPNGERYHDDNIIATLEWENGSVGSIVYAANGDTSLAKERVEVFVGGGVGILDDFRRLEVRRNGSKTVHRDWLRQDKGHKGIWAAFIDVMGRGERFPIPLEDLVSTSRATFGIQETLHKGGTKSIDM
ncbi:MAG: bi-domain-containing oxidoreductase [Gemmatimonadota bacterium]|nr:bi-domain-containing oxidoreductase [Gemmatimonadota bacterium]